MRIYRAIVVDEPFDEADARRCAEEAWEQDCAAGERRMDRVSFMDAVFEMIDLWTLGVTSDEYATFSNVMFTAVVKGDPPILKRLSGLVGAPKAAAELVALQSAVTRVDW